MSEDRFKPQGRKQDIVIQELNDEILIYDLKTNQALRLNETSALVWRACDGGKTIREISGEISRRLNSPVSEEFVWLALEQLKEENLLEAANEARLSFAGLSRREVIRKVGLASMLALPMIFSIVAPTAAHAASAHADCSSTTNRPLGCSCTANTQCTGTSTTRCCSNVPGSSRTCVTARTLRTSGQSCGNNCDCVSNSCVGTGATAACA